MEINDLIEYVKTNMLGRIADEQHNTRLMAETALCDGDHLEIGSLHGGSAIVVALLKKQHGYKGKVVCIDPLDGYYIGSNCPKKWQKNVDPLTDVPVSLETIKENMKRFDVELEIIQAPSIPFPHEQLEGRKFATAYIDGDHWGDAPVLDFFNVYKRVTDYITFDNCDGKHPDVLRACAEAERVWKPFLRQGITCIVKHP